MTGRRGYSVAIVGPDGAGKTTLSQGLRQALAHRKVRQVKVSIHATNWAKGPTPLKWFVRSALGAATLLRARAAILRGEIVIWDRHPMEDRVLGVEGRSVLGTRRGWLARVAPQPDVVVVLDAPVTVLADRNDEHGSEALGRLRRRYRDFAGIHGSHVVDTTATAPEVRDAVLAILERFEADRDRRDGGPGRRP